MGQGYLVGVYCSDVAGAFDRVDRERLGQKLRVSGLHPKVTDFLMSWSEDRVNTVVIGGAHSPKEILATSVFQGTVLGPPLWNLFYADARIAFNARGLRKRYSQMTLIVGGLS